MGRGEGWAVGGWVGRGQDIVLESQQKTEWGFWESFTLLTK